MSTASQLVSNIDPGVDNNTYSTLEQNIENHSKVFMFNFSPKTSFVLKCITSGLYMHWDISKLSIDHLHYYVLYDNKKTEIGIFSAESIRLKPDAKRINK